MTPPPSDHFNGKRFHYPGQTAEKGLLDLLKWQLTGRPARWPERVDFPRRNLEPAPNQGIAATWIGQSTFLLRTKHLAVLTDPILSERASPVSWAGPRRVMPPGLALGDLPRIDFILLSHDHFDHCDLPTLRALAKRDACPVIAPLNHRSLLERAGVPNVIELDWWQTHEARGASFTLVPARHWCRRRPFGGNLRLWGGFMMSAAGRTIYFCGDSGYDESLFRTIRSRCGAPDLALIPIGAYEPRWFMQGAHMNPSEAVQVHELLGSKMSIAMHWGTFQLTDEAREDPPRSLAASCKLKNISSKEFRVVEPGESIAV